MTANTGRSCRDLGKSRIQSHLLLSRQHPGPHRGRFAVATGRAGAHAANLEPGTRENLPEATHLTAGRRRALYRETRDGTDGPSRHGAGGDEEKRGHRVGAASGVFPWLLARPGVGARVGARGRLRCRASRDEHARHPRQPDEHPMLIPSHEECGGELPGITPLCEDQRTERGEGRATGGAGRRRPRPASSGRRLQNATAIPKKVAAVHAETSQGGRRAMKVPRVTPASILTATAAPPPASSPGAGWREARARIVNRVLSPTSSALSTPAKVAAKRAMREHECMNRHQFPLRPSAAFSGIEGSAERRTAWRCPAWLSPPCGAGRYPG